jgi:hypothetical protein
MPEDLKPITEEKPIIEVEEIARGLPTNRARRKFLRAALGLFTTGVTCGALETSGMQSPGDRIRKYFSDRLKEPEKGTDADTPANGYEK